MRSCAGCPWSAANTSSAATSVAPLAVPADFVTCLRPHSSCQESRRAGDALLDTNCEAGAVPAQDPQLRLVVAAALIRAGRVLAARRAAPHPLAGGWEFPGGKVEPGETESSALVRECREELGVAVRVGARLTEVVDEGAGIHLVLYAATLSSGEPAPIEDHDELRWLGVGELDDIAWLPIDLRLVPAVRPHLRGPEGGGRL